MSSSSSKFIFGASVNSSSTTFSNTNTNNTTGSDTTTSAPQDQEFTSVGLNPEGLLGSSTPSIRLVDKTDANGEELVVPYITTIQQDNTRFKILDTHGDNIFSHNSSNHEIMINSNMVIEGNLFVDGSLNITSVTVEGVELGDNVTISGELVVLNNTTLNATEVTDITVTNSLVSQGTTSLEGPTTTTDDLTLTAGGNLRINNNGTLYVSGITTLNSNVFANNNLSVNTNTFLNNLSASGLTSLEVTNINKDVRMFEDARVDGSLNVYGNSRLHGTSTTIDGSLVLLGSSIDISSSSFLAVHGPVLIDGSQVVIHSDRIDISGDLDVSGMSSFVGDVSLVGVMDVSGVSSFVGDVSMVGTLDVSGMSSFVGDVSMVGTLDVSGVSSFVGDVSLVGVMDVSGVSSFVGDVSMVGTLDVSGMSSFVGDVSMVGVTMDIDISSILNVHAPTLFDGSQVIINTNVAQIIAFDTITLSGGHTNITTDTSINGILDLSSTLIANNLSVFQKRPYQILKHDIDNINSLTTMNAIDRTLDISFQNINGYFALDKKKAPLLSRATAEKVLDSWIVQTDNTNLTRDYNFTSMCWSAELGILCAVSYSSGSGRNNNVYISTDGGYTWELITIGDEILLFEVIWIRELGIFCAVAYSNNTSSRADYTVITSPDGRNWTFYEVGDYNWRNLCWAPEINTIFCVGSDSGSQRILKSTDGINWELIDISYLANGNTYYTVAWSNELGVVCAVPFEGTDIIYSKDGGTTWNKNQIPEGTSLWRSIVWSGPLGLFCACSINNENIIISRDGAESWELVDTATLSSITSMALQNMTWAHELGMFVIVDSGVNASNIAYSFNGVDWETKPLQIANIANFASPIGYQLRAICWAAELGSFFAISQSGTNENRVFATSLKNRIPTSTNVFNNPKQYVDDISGSWTFEERLTLKGGVDVSGGTFTVSGGNDIFVTGGGDIVVTGGGDISMNGGNISMNGGNFSVSNGNSLFSGGVGSTTTFDQTIEMSANTIRNLREVLFENNQTSITSTLQNTIYDFGATYYTNPAPNPVNAIAWSPSLNKLLGIADESQYVTSVDGGTTWIYNNTYFNTNIFLTDVIWSADYSKFFVTGYLFVDPINYTSIIFESVNGEIFNFNQSTDVISTVFIRSIAESPSSASSMPMIVLVGDNGVIYTSNDGSQTAWTARDKPDGNSNSWSSVTWAADIGAGGVGGPGRFVAVASAAGAGTPGEGKQVMTSDDGGVTWILRETPANSANVWRSVIWVPELSQFVAVASSGSGIEGTGRQVMTSDDGGVTWTLRETPAANAWRSVSWSAEMGLLVAVASSTTAGGTGSQIMISSDGGVTWTIQLSSETQFLNDILWIGTTNSGGGGGGQGAYENKFVGGGEKMFVIEPILDRNIELRGNTDISGTLNVIESAIFMSDISAVRLYVSGTDDNSANINVGDGNIHDVYRIYFSNGDYIGVGQSLDIFSSTGISITTSADATRGTEFNRINVSDNAAVGGRLDVSGDTNIVGDISLNGSIVAGGSLDVSGAFIVRGETILETMGISGDVILRKDLDVCGNVTFLGVEPSSNFICYSYTDIRNGVFIHPHPNPYYVNDEYESPTDVSLVLHGLLDVSGDISLNGGRLDVSGISSFMGDVSMVGAIDVSGISLFTGDVSMVGALDVSGVSLFTGDVSMNGILDVSGISSFMGDVSMVGALDVSGLSLFTGDVSMVGALDVSGLSLFTGDVSMNCILDVSGISLFTGDVSMVGTLDVSGISLFTGDVSMVGALDVSGLSLFTGDVSVNGVLDMSGISLFTGDVSMVGTLDVSGLSLFTGDVSVNGDVSMVGVLDVSGLSLFTGDVSVNGDVSMAGVLDVSGLSLFTGDVSMVGTLDMSGVSSFVGDVSVNGDVSMVGTLDVSGVSSFIGDVSVNGVLDMSGISLFTGDVSMVGTLDVSGLSLFTGDVSVNGDVSMVGTLDVSGVSSFIGDVSVNGVMDVSGLSLFTGDVSMVGTLDVSGLSLFTGDVSVNGDVSMVGTLDVSGVSSFIGDVSVNGVMDVSGLSLFTGDVSMVGTLDVSGLSLFTGDVSVNGDVSMVGILDMSGVSSFIGDVSVNGVMDVSGLSLFTGDVSMVGTLDMSGLSLFTGDVSVNGDVSMAGVLDVSGLSLFTGDVSMVGTLDVSGLSLFTGDVSMVGTLDMSGVSLFTGDVSMAGVLDVSGISSFIGDVSMVGSMDISGLSLFTGDVSVNGVLDMSGISSFIGDISVNGVLDVSGVSLFTGDVSMVGALDISGVSLFTGDVSMVGALDVSGVSLFTGDVSMAGALDISGVSLFTGDVSMVGALDVSGLSLFTGDVSMVGALDMSGVSLFTGDVSMVGALDVSGVSLFTGDVSMVGDISMVGNVSILGQLDISGPLQLSGDISFGLGVGDLHMNQNSIYDLSRVQFIPRGGDQDFSIRKASSGFVQEFSGIQETRSTNQLITTAPTSSFFESVTYDSSDNLFYAVSSDFNTIGTIRISRSSGANGDTSTWTEVTNDFTPYDISTNERPVKIYKSELLSKFIVITEPAAVTGDDDTTFAKIYTVDLSEGGIGGSNISLVYTHTVENARINSIAESNNRLIVVGEGLILTSDDGITWVDQAATIATAPFNENHWTSIACAPSLGGGGNGLFVAVSNTGTVTDRIITSTDGGVSWTTRAIYVVPILGPGGIIIMQVPANYLWKSITWSPERSEFVIVSDLFGQIAKSSDGEGVTWTIQASISEMNFKSVVWCSDLGGSGVGMYVAVASSSSDNKNVAWSTDGSTWNLISSSTVTYYGVAASPTRVVGVGLSSYAHTISPTYLSVPVPVLEVNGKTVFRDTTLVYDGAKLGVGYFNVNDVVYQLDVCGNGRVNGDLFVLNTSTASDVRHKENIQTISGALELVSQLRGVTYDNMIYDPPRRSYGFIAQEVQGILPEVVTQSEDSDYLTVNYPVIVSLATESIKTLNAKIAELDSRVIEQGSKIAELDSKVAELDSRVIEQGSKIAEQDSIIVTLLERIRRLEEKI
jgi:hypothetical protein